MRLFAVFICLGCIVCAWLQLHHYLALLPSKIAVRFDIHGQPGGWTDKKGFTLQYLFLLGVIMGVFGIFAAIVHKLPARFINIPHRDYWLAIPQRKGTLDYLRELYLWSAAFGGIFIVGVMEMIIRANLNPPAAITGRFVYTAFGTFAIFVVCGIALVYWRFKKPATNT